MMLEVTVKTLDSQNRSFIVPDESTVKDFKQQIAPVLGIEADKQRLIFCGRVLQDDKKLQEYNVDGKVIHLVQRPPPQSQAPRTGAATNASGSATSSSGAGSRADRDGSSFLLGAFNIPRDVFDPNHVQNIVQDVVSGMGEWGRNATVMSRTSEDGSSVDVHINLGVSPLQSEAQSRLNQVQSMLTRANTLLQVLENVSNRREGNSEASDATQQTSDVSADIDIEEQNNGMPPLTSARALDVPLFTQFYERSNSEGGLSFLNAEDLNLPGTPSTSGASATSETPSFGEGIAQAARAAVAAAVAAAANAAAAAAARVSTTPSSTHTSTSTQANRSAAASQTAAQASQNENTPLLPSAEQDRDIPQPQDVPVSASSNGRTFVNGSSIGPFASTSTTASGRQGQRPIQPSVHALLPLWDEITSLNNRLQPHIQRCMDYVRSESALSRTDVHEAQTMFDWISKILHFMAHAYHNFSDLYVNFNQPAPRTLRVRIVASSSSPTFLHSSSVPFQAQVSISSPHPPNPSEEPSTSVQAPRTQTTSANSSTDQASTRTTAETTSTTSTHTTSSFSSGSGMPLLFNSSPSPFVFMEVSPGAITIDSISAAIVDAHRSGVVTTAPSAVPTTSSASASTDTRPTAADRPQPPTTTTATTTSESHSELPRVIGYTSLNPFMNSASASLPPLRGFNPMNFPPLNNLSSIRSFDPNLPCNSIWALDSSVRRRHNAGRLAQPAPSVPVNVTSSSGGRQGDILHNVISGLVNTVLTEATTVSGSRPITATASIPGFAVFAASASPDDPVQPCIHGSQSASNEQRASNTESRNSNSQPNAASQNSTSQNTTSRAPPLFTDEHLVSFIQGMQMQSASAGGMTISEFVSRFVGNDFVENQSLLSDLIACISREWTFHELSSVFFGETAPINQIRPVLQRFINEKVLKGGELNEENITRAARQLALEAKPIVDYIVAETNIRSDVDYPASFRNYCRQNLENIVYAILCTTEDDAYGSTVYKAFRQAVFDFISLTVFSFADGQESVQRIVEQRTPSTSPMMQRWVHSQVFQNFVHNLHRLSLANNNVSEYIVYMNVPSSPDSPPVPNPYGPYAQGEAAAEMSNGMASDSSPMSTESAPEQLPTTDGAEATVEGATAESNLPAAATRGSSTLSTNSNSLNATSEEYPDVVIGSENWHNSVPRDWVPIISRDVHRQRRQASQSPFSDAYIEGMPSKRRKVMTNGASSSLLGPVPSLLSEGLQQAIDSTGAQPQTSVEQIKREVTNDPSLQTAYKEQVKCAIQERLRNDMDYSPERFPNAEKYFNKGSQ